MSLFSQIKNLFSGGDSSSPSSVLAGITDFHSHILPGVDDGVQSLDESLLILDEYEKRGMKRLWLTPHIMEDIPNTPAKLRERFHKLQQAYNGGIELNLAAENMIDNLFIERLESNDLLPLDGDKLLVETSYYDAPYDYIDTLERIISMGLTVVLAHPERYNYMDMAYYQRLKNMGLKFQLNLLSLTKYYGPQAETKSLKLLEAGFYDLVGSDIHSVNQIRAIDKISRGQRSHLISSGICPSPSPVRNH